MKHELCFNCAYSIRLRWDDWNDHAILDQHNYCVEKRARGPVTKCTSYFYSDTAVELRLLAAAKHLK